MKAYISINSHVIRANAKRGTDDPPIRIARGKSGKPSYAREIRIMGPSRLIYNASNPLLKCGARMVLEAEPDDVQVIR